MSRKLGVCQHLFFIRRESLRSAIKLLRLKTLLVTNIKSLKKCVYFYPKIFAKTDLNMQKKIFILGGSHSDYPLVESSIISGFEIITSGNRPDHPSHWSAHKYIPGDFSNKASILEIAKDQKIDFIVAGANDYALISASYVAEKLDLFGYDTFENTLKIHHKDKFKLLAHQLDLPISEFEIIDEYSQYENKKYSYPVLIKPINLTGGKGMTLVEPFQSIKSAIDYAQAVSKQNIVIVEKWFEGSLHSYSTYVQDSRVVFEYFDTELCLYQDFLVSTSLSICKISVKLKKQLKESTERIVNSLGLVNGVFHCQFMVKKNQMIILEYTRRISGDLYSKVIQLISGFRHSDLFIGPVTNPNFYFEMNNKKKLITNVARHCITSLNNGFFKGILVDDEIKPFIHSITLNVPLGSKVTSDGRSKVATAILIFPNQIIMQDKTYELKKYFECIVLQS